MNRDRKERRAQLTIFCLLLLCLPFIVLTAVAEAAVSLTLRLDRTEAALADSVRMIVALSGTRSSDGEPVLRGLESFHVSRGGISSRVQIINGQLSGGVEYTYFIQPKKVGTFQIGPAEITTDGKIIKSNTASLTVGERGQFSGEDRGPLFLTASASSEEAFLEEQILYTLKLYLLANVKDISLELPEREGFTFKQLGEPSEYRSVYQGHDYRVLEIRYALIPSREGVHTVGPSRVNLTVLERRGRSRRSIFDDPFFSFDTGRPLTLTSNILELKVHPLPEKGRPADFSGLVGTFQIESRIEPSKLKAGESATLTVLLSGHGNVNRIPDLELPALDNVKVYGDQPVLETKPNGRSLGGSKMMKWAVVPEQEGIYDLPPLTVSFFDPSKERYRTIETTSHTLTVEPSKGHQPRNALSPGAGISAGQVSKQEVKELGRDILPVHTSIRDLETGLLKLPASPLLWGLLVAPFFAYAVVICVLRFRKDSARASAVAKRKKAASLLISRCRHGDVSARELIEAVRGYVNDRFGLSLGSLTSQEALDILRSRGVSPEPAEGFARIVQKLEDQTYSGRADDASKIKEGIPELIRGIERDLP
jgi:hypothetical protein